MNGYVDLSALRNVALVALVTGVGITVLFSVAVRALASAEEHPDHSLAVPRLLAAGCLLVVTAAIAVGLWAVLAK
jgi:protein-S-isoprenylcysteine O-methyltransferase Ste14